MIEETDVTKSIIQTSVERLLDNTQVEVAIAGGGPSGLTAARVLAEKGVKTALFEKKLSLGGGMWGGGMMYPTIVVQEEAKHLLEEIGVKCDKKGNQYTANSIEAAAKLISEAVDAGAQLFNGITVEDVMIRENRINGMVINWSSVNAAGLHVDPLCVKAEYCVEATGHPLEVCRVAEEKVGGLDTPTGKIQGEKSMWAESAEQLVVENTRQVYPGLYVTGMAANAVFGSPRMGPVFGGMLLSGERVAELILEEM